MEKIFNWLDENYIEEKESIFKIIESACIKHACSIQSLFEACQMIKQYNPDKTSLRREVEMLAKLSDHGIMGYDAGRRLRIAFDVNHILYEKAKTKAKMKVDCLSGNYPKQSIWTFFKLLFNIKP